MKTLLKVALFEEEQVRSSTFWELRGIKEGLPANGGKLKGMNAWWGCDRVGTPTNIINPIDSGRIRTAKSFNIQNARIEIDAKLPRGDWLWPAIWMLPKE